VEFAPNFPGELPWRIGDFPGGDLPGSSSPGFNPLRPFLTYPYPEMAVTTVTTVTTWNFVFPQVPSRG
jgi:hypothetical protein